MQPDSQTDRGERGRERLAWLHACLLRLPHRFVVSPFLVPVPSIRILQVDKVKKWWATDRYAKTKRPYTAEEVVRLRSPLIRGTNTGG